MKPQVFISKILSADLLSQLDANQADFFMQSLIEIRNLDFVVPELKSKDLILIHSINGAKILLENERFKKEISKGKLSFWVPGQKTLAFIKSHFGGNHEYFSFAPHLWQEKGSELLTQLSINNIISFQSAASGRTFLNADFNGGIVEIEIYLSKAKSMVIKTNVFDYVLLTSPMNVRIFTASKTFNDQTKWFCIGQSTAKELKRQISDKAYLKVLENADIELMVNELVCHL